MTGRGAMTGVVGAAGRGGAVSVWRGLARPPPVPARGSRARRAGAADCTTPHHKTHSTGAGDEVGVLYAWHPWAGRPVRLEEVIARATGAAARCSLVDAPVTRLQEIPVWMLDPVACGTVAGDGAAGRGVVRAEELARAACRCGERQGPSPEQGKASISRVPGRSPCHVLRAGRAGRTRNSNSA